MKVGDIVYIDSYAPFAGAVGEIIQYINGIELPYRVKLFGNPSLTTWFYSFEIALATDQQALEAKLR